MGPGDLARALAPLPHRDDPRLLVGRETFDDAGVFLVSDDLALVQTVDFFAPIVDDPYTFGRIAAANALSDVYAMGGEPLTALNIVGFPASAAPLEVLTEILRGGQDTVHEAGAFIVGGHSIIDEEIKYGLAVTGRADPRRLLTNAGAKPGDRLILTKAIGTGILSTAAKSGALSDETYDGMIASMSALNRDASRAALEVGATCATDITGFGLLGHASHIARASNVSIEIRIRDVPVLPGASQAWRDGARTGGAERNVRYLDPMVKWGDATEEERAVLIDPQTSGGLLVALPAAAARDYIAQVAGAIEIGAVITSGTHAISLV
ncbi:MAG TPA: selenide, water dikinase SelD [Gemmatimonadaceae bacterium]|nr:selenide, water dikinase SelD [Gemmatimonadaceae bacterium]